MADTIKEAQVKITASDQTKAGTDSVKRNLKGVGQAAQKTQQKMQGFVSEQTGRNLSQFNEKTEKGRQLLTTFGGAVGGAAGNVVYYAGTLSYVIGRFSLLELGVMAGIAAIGGLAWAMTAAVPDVESLAERIERTTKSTDDLIKKTNEYVLAQADAIAQTGSAAIQQRELRQEIAEQEGTLGRLRAEADKFKAMIGEGNFLHKFMYEGDLAELNGKIQQSALRLSQLRSGVVDLKRTAAGTLAAAGTKEGEAAAKSAAAKAEREQKARWLKMQAERMKTQRQLVVEYEAIARRNTERNKAEEEARRSALIANIDFTLNARRNELALLDTMERDQDARDRERIQQAVEREQYAADLRHEIAMSSIELVGIVAQAIGEGTAAGTAFKVAAIVAEAAYLSALEIGKGFASLANPFGGLEAAAHFLAAAKLAAVGAVQVAGAVGGGGGGGASFGAGAQSRGAMPARRDAEQAQEKVIIYVSGHLINTKPGYDQVFADGVQSYQESQNPGRESGSF